MANSKVQKPAPIEQMRAEREAINAQINTLKERARFLSRQIADAERPLQPRTIAKTSFSVTQASQA